MPVLNGIAARAVHELLLGRHYDERQLAAVRDMRGYEIETALVEAGTYYVLEVDEGMRRKLGYRLVDRVEAQLSDEVVVVLAHMRKDLAPVGAAVPRA